MATKNEKRRAALRAARNEVLNKALQEAFSGTVHELKSWPENFAATVAGLKPYETRLDNRGFEVGDRLKLREWIPVGSNQGAYTGRELLLAVTRIAPNDYGLRDGWVTMTVKPARDEVPAT